MSIFFCSPQLVKHDRTRSSTYNTPGIFKPLITRAGVPSAPRLSTVTLMKILNKLTDLETRVRFPLGAWNVCLL
jgi:hypothetical protein